MPKTRHGIRELKRMLRQQETDRQILLAQLQDFRDDENALYTLLRDACRHKHLIQLDGWVNGSAITPPRRICMQCGMNEGARLVANFEDVIAHLDSQGPRTIFDWEHIEKVATFETLNEIPEYSLSFFAPKGLHRRIAHAKKRTLDKLRVHLHPFMDRRDRKRPDGASSQFWATVSELSLLRNRIPEERRALSGTRSPFTEQRTGAAAR